MAFPKFIRRLIAPAIKAVQAATNKAFDRVTGQTEEDRARERERVEREQQRARLESDRRWAEQQAAELAAKEFAQSVADLARTTASAAPTPPSPQPEPIAPLTSEEDGDLLDAAADARTTAPKPPPPTVPRLERGRAKTRRHQQAKKGSDELSHSAKAHLALFQGGSYTIVRKSGTCAIRGCGQPSRGMADFRDDNGPVPLCKDGIWAFSHWWTMVSEIASADRMPRYWKTMDRFESWEREQTELAEKAARDPRKLFQARVARVRQAIATRDFPQSAGEHGDRSVCDTNDCNDAVSEWRLFIDTKNGRDEFRLCVQCGKAAQEIRFQLLDKDEPVPFFIFSTPEKAKACFKNREALTQKRAVEARSRPQVKAQDLMPNPYHSPNQKSRIGEGKKAAKEAKRAAKAAEQAAKDKAEREAKEAEVQAASQLSEEEQLKALEAEDAAKKAQEEAELRVLEKQIAALDAAEKNGEQATNGKLSKRQKRELAIKQSLN